MKWIMKGKVWKFGDNVESESIITMDIVRLHPTDPKYLAKYCMVTIDPDFPKKVNKGDFIVAGRNFGCGHGLHWEGPLAIKGVGISALIVESVARDFFRTAITFGLPILLSRGIMEKVNQGDELEIDLTKGKITNLSSGETIEADSLPDYLVRIVKAGGLIDFLKEEKGSPLF